LINFVALNTDDGKRIDRVIQNHFNGVARNVIYKALRKRDVKLNGTRVSDNIVVHTGDNVIAYISEEICKDSIKESLYETVYSDDNIIVVSKKQGLAVQRDKNDETSLLDLVKSEYGPSCELCHRIDRNTGGLVVLGRNENWTQLLMQKFESHEIKKEYKCIVFGKLELSDEYTDVKAWLFKDNKKSLVFIYDEPHKGAREIHTLYKCVRYDESKNMSYLEIELETGRTHQIRAQMAHLGHPVVGDGKYGTNLQNRKCGFNYQALWASGLEFKFDYPVVYFVSKPDYK